MKSSKWSPSLVCQTCDAVVKKRYLVGDKWVCIDCAREDSEYKEVLE